MVCETIFIRVKAQVEELLTIGVIGIGRKKTVLSINDFEFCPHAKVTCFKDFQIARYIHIRNQLQVEATKFGSPTFFKKEPNIHSGSYGSVDR